MMIESWGEKGYVQKTEHTWPRGLIQYDNIWNIVNEIERNVILIQL